MDFMAMLRYPNVAHLTTLGNMESKSINGRDLKQALGHAMAVGKNGVKSASRVSYHTGSRVVNISRPYCEIDEFLSLHCDDVSVKLLENVNSRREAYDKLFSKYSVYLLSLSSRYTDNQLNEVIRRVLVDIDDRFN